MSDFELADTFYTIASLLDQIIGSFITLLFAFLVAAYLVSSKLDRPMVIIVIALYSCMAIRYTFLYLNISGDMVALADRISLVQQQEGSALDWLVIGQGLASMHYTQTATMFLCFLASLVFFFFMRHRAGRNDE